MSYTKGPWTLEEVGDKVKHLCPAKDGTSLLTIAVEYDDEGESHYFASVWSRDDAHVIAAAPELLEALKAFKRDWLELSGRMRGTTLDAIDKVIAKAEGRTE